MEAAPKPNAKAQESLVSVTLTLTDPDGNTQTETKALPGGATDVTTLKAELGVPAESALWVIEKSGKKRQLGDHERDNVKQGDRFEALVRGGIS